MLILSELLMTDVRESNFEAENVRIIMACTRSSKIFSVYWSDLADISHFRIAQIIGYILMK